MTAERFGDWPDVLGIELLALGGASDAMEGMP
jgi:hypothetical protein